MLFYHSKDNKLKKLGVLREPLVNLSEKDFHDPVRCSLHHGLDGFVHLTSLSGRHDFEVGAGDTNLIEGDVIHARYIFGPLA